MPFSPLGQLRVINRFQDMLADVVDHSKQCENRVNAKSKCPIRCQVEMSCLGRLAGAPWRGPRRLGMTLRVSAADPFGQLTGASVFVGGIALVKSRS